MSPCWQCGKPTSEALFCPHCNALQPPPADYYRLLGLPEDQLNLNSDDLQRRFYELSRLLHPDRFMRKPEIERQYSLDAASVLNDAYRSLRDPVKRALYVLKKHGFEIGEQNAMNEAIPQISVVIPLYNKRFYIRRAVDSVLAQSLRDFDILRRDGNAAVVRRRHFPGRRFPSSAGPSATLPVDRLARAPVPTGPRLHR